MRPRNRPANVADDQDSPNWHCGRSSAQVLDCPHWRPQASAEACVCVVGTMGSLQAHTVSVIDVARHKAVAVLATPVPTSREISGFAVARGGTRVFLNDGTRDQTHVLKHWAS